MSITLVGTGGCFTRIGKMVDWLNKINANRLTEANTELLEIDAQFASTRGDIIDSLHLNTETYRRSQDQLTSYLRSIAEQTIILMAYDDAGSAQTLQAGMTELIRQMTASSDDVDAPTVSASAAAGGSNAGNGVMVVNVKTNTGVDRQYIVAETIRAKCTNDSFTGDATLGQEVFTAVGEAAVDDMLSENWPQGSGADVDIQACDADEDADENLLTNSSFDTFTVAHTPDSWTIAAGVAGVSILAAGAGSAFVTTGNAISFVGDGAVKPSLKQAVTDIKPATPYAVNFWSKVSSVPGAGVLRVSLMNASGTVLTDDAGTSLSVSVTLSGETTSYASHTATFITPKSLVGTTYICVEETTALSNTVTLYIDHLALQEQTELYAGGPTAAIFSGSNAFVKDDVFTITVNNNYAGDFQQAFQRLFDMRSLGLQLPFDTGGTETINDSLIS